MHQKTIPTNMNCIKQICCLSLLLVSLSVTGTGIAASDYRAFKISISDGLHSNIVRDITQDESGYLWMASIHGLYRYDGYTMKQVIRREDLDSGLIPDLRTVSLHRWGDRFLWVRLRGNFYCCYDLYKNKFVRYTKSTKYDSFTTGFFGNPGEVWLYGHQGGCRRITFDGKEFHATDYIAKAGSPLLSDQIHFICQGAYDRIWIGTKQGLVLARKGQLTAVGSRALDVRHMVMLDKGEYFVCADGSVLCFRNGQLRTMAKGVPSMVGITGAAAYSGGILITTQGDTYDYHVKDHSLQRCSLATSPNSQVYHDIQGNTLIFGNGSNHILYVRAKDYRLFGAVLPNNSGNTSPVSNLQMVTTANGDVLISTFGRGLYIYHPESGEVQQHLQRRGFDALINTNYLFTVFLDRLGNVWIGQEDFGLSCLRPIMSNVDFSLLSRDFSATCDFHDNCVRMLSRTRSGAVYVASLTHLLYTYEGKDLKPFPNPWGSILAVADGSDGTLWLGTRQGLVVGSRLYSHYKDDPFSLSSNKISGLCLDRQGRMWIAAFGGGLDIAVPSSGGQQSSPVYTFRHFLTANAQQREARCLLSDHHGRMWLGSGDGCYVFNPDQLLKNDTAYRHLNVNSNAAMDEIHAIYEDHRHRVWTAITGTGVACYDNSGQYPRLIRLYTPADGLGDIAVQSVTEDKQGRIFVGTNSGLSVFDEKEGVFHTYQLGRTRMGNIFMENATCQLPDGRLAFGTKEGLVTFNPSRVTARKSNRFLAITDILVDGIPINEVSPLNDAVDHAKNITLDYDQNSLTFNFSDFSFDHEQRTLYTCQLKGYDKDWQPLTSNPTAVYRNLKPGQYTLLLRSCNDEGIWNEQTRELSIRIRPPFWATWYAWLFYLLVAAFIAYSIYRQLLNMNNLRNKIRVEQQLSEYKVQFFTNISHEFRTPLTIIQGAMERIHNTGNIPGNLKQPVGNMQKSVKRLSRLISRLMEFRKLQENQMELAVEETDVVSFLREIWSTFRDVAENKRINYTFSTFANGYTLLVDRRKLDSIAYNLISNALKYTPSGGSVAVRLGINNDHQQLLIEVKDTGIGISKERQKHLFMRYQQHTSAYDSIGIGLNVSLQLAMIHKGSVTFSENPEGGSVFTLSLPTDKKVYSEADYAKEMAATIIEEDLSKKKWLEDYKEVAPQPLNDRRLLIVEDDADVRDFMATELRYYFEVMLANDGREAWELIGEQRPDIIVSDVSMPMMNGFELTQRIKHDKTLSDIPVVLLTALTDDMKRERGFQVGADDYIQKPFSIRTLVARLSQLLEQRDKLRNSYSAAEAAPVVAVVKDERDRKFLNALDNWIYGHLTDSTLNVDELASNMGFGRSSFYRKVNGLTGLTPNNYIRRIRMEKSKELLENSNFTISEIAYKTGFSSAFYFSKLFKEYYGMPPSQFRNGEKG